MADVYDASDGPKSHPAPEGAGRLGSTGDRSKQETPSASTKLPARNFYGDPSARARGTEELIAELAAWRAKQRGRGPK
jgi:hypothetical protein